MNSKHSWFDLLLFIVVVSLLAELSSRFGLMPNYILPAPSEVLISWRDAFEEYLAALLSTAISSLLGICISAIVGVTLALIFSLWPRFERMILPICVFFQTVPVIAIAPLMVIWFGFGRPTVVASSCVVSFFPILANTILGLQSSSRGQKDLLQLLGASPIQTLVYLKIPSAVPSILTGLRIASGLAIVGSLVGEFVGGGGLGSLIDSARTQQKTEMVFGAVLLSSALGLAFIASLRLLSLSLKKYLAR